MWPFPFISYHNKAIGCRVATRFQQGIVDSVMRMNELETLQYYSMLQKWPDTDSDDYMVAVRACNARQDELIGNPLQTVGPFTQLCALVINIWGALFNASLKREARQYFKDQNNRNR